MTTKTKSALEEHDELAQNIETAKTRLAELDQQQRAGRIDLERTSSALRGYFRSIESGDAEPDHNREQRLREELRLAQARVTPHSVVNHRAEVGEERKLEMVDPEMDGQLDGARERLKSAEATYHRFVLNRFDDLVVELGALGVEFADRYALAAKHAERGSREWRELRSRWRPLVDVADFGWADFPQNPFEGVDLKPLMPKQVAEGKSFKGPARAVRRKS